MNRLCHAAFPDKAPQAGLDLEAIEMSVRSSMHRVGAALLQKIMNADNGGYRGSVMDCGAGHVAKFVDCRAKGLDTVLGRVSVLRAYYHCETCGKGLFPKDALLDIEKTGFSPGLRRMMALVGAKESFDAGRDDLRLLAGVNVTDKDVERHSEAVGENVEVQANAARQEAVVSNVIPLLPPIENFTIAMDGTGVPMVTKETQGRIGKGEDGIAKTREAKLGVMFEMKGTDKDGNPIRDRDTTVYTGGIETCEDFGDRLYAEAMRRGLARATTVSVLGDGAAWIWNIADDKFPKAIQIVDYFHASEHLGDLAKVIHGKNIAIRDLWLDMQRRELWDGDVEVVIEAMRRIETDNEDAKEMIRKTVQYFETNRHRMRYAEFRKMGLFVGSGVIEAGCKTIVGQRLKQSGMRWTVRGANAIIALRCCQLSGQWEDYWENRRAA